MDLEEKKAETLNAYGVYVIYVSMKIHFTTKTYDFFKSKPLPAFSKNSFNKRKDKYFFNLLSGQTKEYYIDYFVANFLQNKKFWIGDVELGEKNYKKHLAKRDSLTYNFKSELKHLRKKLGDNVEIKDGKLPYLLTLYYEGKISLETLIMIMDFLKIHDFFNEKLEGDTLWESLSFIIEKYKRFFRYDIVKYKNIFVDFCKSCREEV